MASRLTWLGDSYERNVTKAVASGLGEFGLRCEARAKQKLFPGHGVVTSTLRRSIHCAVPGYSWGGDSVPPSSSTPERGGSGASAVERGGKMSLEFGSGMEYAMAVHQGSNGRAGYHFITEAVEEEAPNLPRILQRHVRGI